MKFKISLIGLLITCYTLSNAQKVDFKKAFLAAELQTDLLIKNVDSARKLQPSLVSPRTVENGEFKMVKSWDWTSGFFPAQLWFYYEFDQDKKWLDLAKKYTKDIKKEQFNKGTHDLGS